MVCTVMAVAKLPGSLFSVAGLLAVCVCVFFFLCCTRCLNPISAALGRNQNNLALISKCFVPTTGLQP